MHRKTRTRKTLFKINEQPTAHQQPLRPSPSPSLCFHFAFTFSVFEQLVQLAALVELHHLGKVTDILVVDEEHGGDPGAGLGEDLVTQLLCHVDIDGDPVLKVRALVDVLALEQVLQGLEVAADLLVVRGGAVVDADLAAAAEVLALVCAPGVAVALPGRRQGLLLLLLRRGGWFGLLLRREHARGLALGGRGGLVADTLGVLEVRDVHHHTLVIDVRVGEVLAIEKTRDVEKVARLADTFGVVCDAVLGLHLLRVGHQLRLATDGVAEGAEDAAAVPVRGEVGHGLGPGRQHRVDPLEEEVLGVDLGRALGLVRSRCLEVDEHLVVVDDRPEETENELGVAVVNVARTNVDERQAVLLGKLDGIGEVLQAVRLHAGVLVVLAHRLARADLEQLDEVDAGVKVLLQVLDGRADRLELGVGPLEEGLCLDVGPGLVLCAAGLDLGRVGSLLGSKLCNALLHRHLPFK
eukprot:m.75219 g.75219  ORF g.75219 m.75219 type:complete len:466 (-) comp14566_c0_seq1:40-1437(-)